jgi:hypothetical protein
MTPKNDKRFEPDVLRADFTALMDQHHMVRITGLYEKIGVGTPEYETYWYVDLVISEITPDSDTVKLVEPRDDEYEEVWIWGVQLLESLQVGENVIRNGIRAISLNEMER